MRHVILVEILSLAALPWQSFKVIGWHNLIGYVVYPTIHNLE